MNEDLEFDIDPDDELDYLQDGPGLFDDPLPDPAPACDLAHQNGDLLEPDAGQEENPANVIPRPEAPLALYRRYRPDTFTDVIGQEHVTTPLMRAIGNNRVNHAYLFSGPRGCGKTTSARILARCLNCADGPTPTPCGVCESCRALATGGPGSIDVIEIDAASHGRVDDARELREGVYFAPVSSRYKVYIIDEAHMVTKEGFNALLKVVEEPPPHVKFIFATTEPEKVIGTIRSRTHHYPFRLVPPRVLADYLERICHEEQVQVDAGVLPLVVRAGAGSVRDSLSVLDQLLGAAGGGLVDYDHAAALLGYTPDALLDEIVDAFAAGDGQGVFSAIDKVISMGQDPRRFAEDLLQRMRDLVIIAQVPDALSSGLIDAPGDAAERLSNQAALLGAGELTRAAEVIAAGLVAMRGTTAPRLHLELVCSRVLLPAADADGRGLHARLDRLERRLNVAGVPSENASATSERAPASPPGWQDETELATGQGSGRRIPGGEEHRQKSAEPGAQAAQQRPAQQRPASRPSQSASTIQEHPAADTAPPAGGQHPMQNVSTADVRRLWPAILDEVRSRKRFTHALLNQEAHVIEVRGKELLLGFSSQPLCDNFRGGGSVDVLRESIVKVVGADLVIQATVDGGPITPARPADPPGPAQRPPAQRPAAQPAPPQPRAATPAAPEKPNSIRQRVTEDVAAQQVTPPPDPDDEVSEDDEILAETGEDIAELLAREFDAEIIPEDE